VTDSNFHDVVQVTSVSKNSAAGLAEALRQVWTPALRTAGVDSLFLKKLELELLGPKSTASLVEEESFMRDKARGARSPAESKLYEQAVLYLKSIRRELESAAIARCVPAFPSSLSLPIPNLLAQPPRHYHDSEQCDQANSFSLSRSCTSRVVSNCS
jgi:hypothetical protein